MKARVTFTQKDAVVLIGCVLFLLANLGAIGPGGRRRAKEALCLSNLRQWGIIWKMYTDENNGYFTRSVFWVNPLRAYYSKDPKIRCCPAATRPESEGGQHPFAAWGIWNGVQWRQTYHNDYGSYGMNGWVCKEAIGGGRWEEALWKTPNVKGAGDVPMFLDCSWYENVCPKHSDQPPEYDGQPLWGNDDEMKICCMNRHNGGINAVFLDFSARKVGLKELWTLKWHRQYDTKGPYTTAGGVLPYDWPMWMREFRDY